MTKPTFHSPGARLAAAFGLTFLFVIGEAIAGFYANSLALLTDAAHNLTDVVALGLSWYAIRLAMRPAHAGMTYGYHRSGILVAMVNSSTLVVIALGIFYEAYRRFIEPPQVKSDVLIAVGVVAFIVNLVTAWMVHRGSDKDLNLRSAFVHLMGDVLSTIGAVAAGIAIYFTGLNWLDPLVSVFIGGLILWNALVILRQTVEILLESTPRDVDVQQIVNDLLSVEGVHGVHDLHIWSINQGLRALSAHLLTEDITLSRGAEIQRQAQAILIGRHAISHATLQLECENCEPLTLYCNMMKSSNEIEKA